MILQLELTDTKKEKWAAKLEGYIAAGSIPHKEIESLTGRLSYSQNSIFGRFGGHDASPFTGNVTPICTTRIFRAGCY